jgi:light-regulated signal transduction histidine kinase (bacteriophytochrome)
LYISVIVVFTILLLFIAVIYSNKRKSNKLLLEKNELIHRQNLELEQLNKELESFCYSVSHDLKAPLRSISGYSTVLSEDCREQLDDSAKEYLGKIVNSAGKMSNLIDSLLDLSRISLRTIKKKSVNLSEIVHEVSQHLKERNPERKIVFKIAEGVFAQCDSNFISIALQNLLDNAVKYTSGREEAIIEFGIENKNDEGVVYYIKDNGVGYDDQYANKLFKAFQRLHSPDEFPGTGVGLATVYRIIAKHGGKIWSDSVLDEGAVFYFTL